MKRVREEARTKRYQRKHYMTIRVVSKKIRCIDLKRSVRQILDEEETGEQHQHKIPSLTGETNRRDEEK